jgi:hypothetical protein
MEYPFKSKTEKITYNEVFRTGVMYECTQTANANHFTVGKVYMCVAYVQNCGSHTRYIVSNSFTLIPAIGLHTLLKAVD